MNFSTLVAPKSSIEEQPTCPISLMAFEEHDVRVSLNCGCKATFGLSSLCKWLELESTCPACGRAVHAKEEDTVKLGQIWKLSFYALEITNELIKAFDSEDEDYTQERLVDVINFERGHCELQQRLLSVNDKANEGPVTNTVHIRIQVLQNILEKIKTQGGESFVHAGFLHFFVRAEKLDSNDPVQNSG